MLKIRISSDPSIKAFLVAHVAEIQRLNLTDALSDNYYGLDLKDYIFFDPNNEEDLFLYDPNMTIQTSCILLSYLFSQNITVMKKIRHLIIPQIFLKIKNEIYLDIEEEKLNHILNELILTEGVGKSIGMYVNGAKGVGKSFFCRQLIFMMHDLAPWLFDVIYNTEQSFFTSTHFLHPNYLQKSFLQKFQPNSQTKIKLSLIDDLDLLSQQSLSNLQHLLLQQQSDLFIFATGSKTMYLQQAMHASQYPQYLYAFHTLRVFDMPLQRAFYFLTHDSGSEMSQNSETVPSTETALLLHNMKIGDLLKVKMHLRQGKSLHDLLHNRDLLSGLSPAVVNAASWVRHDFSPNNYQEVIQLAKTIYNQFQYGQQNVHFVPLNEHPMSLLHHLHRLFQFRSSFVCKSPQQISPRDPFHSSSLPQHDSNPFCNFINQHTQSLLCLLDLDTVIGFHAELENESEDVSAKGTMNEEHVHQHQSYSGQLGLSLGSGMSLSQGITRGLTNTEALITGAETLGNLDFKLSLTGPALIAGLEHLWDTERSQGRQQSSALSQAFGYSPSLGVSFGRGAGSGSGHSLKQGKVWVEERAKKKGEVERFLHAEVLVRVLRGLRDAKESGQNLVIVFYKSHECFEEVVYEKLGWLPENKVNGSRTCLHYQRELEVYAECCQSYFGCQHCHDEQQPAHHLNPKQIKKIRCGKCFEEQLIEEMPLPNRCMHCHAELSQIACLQCRIWRNRVGPDFDSIKHCSQCDSCFTEKYYTKHLEICRHSLYSS